MGKQNAQAKKFYLESLRSEGMSEDECEFVCLVIVRIRSSPTDGKLVWGKVVFRRTRTKMDFALSTHQKSLRRLLRHVCHPNTGLLRLQHGFFSLENTWKRHSIWSVAITKRKTKYQISRGKILCMFTFTFSDLKLWFGPRIRCIEVSSGNDIRPVTRILCGGVLTWPKWTKLPKCIFYLILFNWRLVNF